MTINREAEFSARIAVLETKVETMTTELKLIDGKLDELLFLKNKGVGAFWLASALMGTGIASVFIKLVGWMKGIDL